MQRVLVSLVLTVSVLICSCSQSDRSGVQKLEKKEDTAQRIDRPDTQKLEKKEDTAQRPELVSAGDDEISNTLKAMNAKNHAYWNQTESSGLGVLPDPEECASVFRQDKKIYTGRPLRKLPDAEQNEVRNMGGGGDKYDYPIGITGARGNRKPDRKSIVIVVTSVEPGSLASGELKKGDKIVGAYGYLFPKGEDPRVPLGYALVEAQTEFRKGDLVLDVVRNNQVLQVTIKLGIDPYSATWPYNCKKSDRIAKDYVDYTLANTEMENIRVYWGTLVLMGAGGDKGLEAVRRAAYRLADMDRKRLGHQGMNSWSSAPQLLTLAEYYLLTGDSVVWDAMEHLAKVLYEGQMPAGTWSHNSPPGGYGAVNAAGQVCFLSLVLAHEAGVEVPEDVLLRSIRFFGKFLGGPIPYGVQSPNWGFGKGSNCWMGRCALNALTFHVLGAHELADRSSRSAAYAHKGIMCGHAEHISAIAWIPPGVAYGTKAEFRLLADNLQWYMEVARRRDGHIEYLGGGNVGWFGPGGPAMVYALPYKRLRVFGAEKGVFSREAPASLKPVLDLYRAKKWNDAKRTLTGLMRRLRGTDLAYAKRLQKALTGVDKHAEATLALASENLTAGRKARAARQVKALKRFLGEERPQMTELVAKIGPAAMSAAMPSPGRGGKSSAGSYLASKEILKSYPTWWIKGKSPEQIVRHFAHPDGKVQMAAVKELASRPSEALPVAKKLMNDSHPAISAGAWETLAEIAGSKQGSKYLGDTTQLYKQANSAMESASQFLKLSLLRALIALAPDETTRINAYLKSLDTDPATIENTVALSFLRRYPGGRGDGVWEAAPVTETSGLVVQYLRGALDSLNKNECRSALTIKLILQHIARHRNQPEARKAAAEIAYVLHHLSHELRGMFTDQVMRHGLPVIEKYLDPELEKTPYLISGLCRCLIKVPKHEWPGWVETRLMLKDIIYNLSKGALPEIEKTIAEQREWFNNSTKLVVSTAVGGSKFPESEWQDDLKELAVWAATLRKAGNNLKPELLRLAQSDNVFSRRVALSATFAGHVKDAESAAEIVFTALSGRDDIHINDLRLACVIVNNFEGNKAFERVIPVVLKDVEQIPPYPAGTMRGWRARVFSFSKKYGSGIGLRNQAQPKPRRRR